MSRNYSSGTGPFHVVITAPVQGHFILDKTEGYRATGIGVQFSEQDGGLVRNKIETYLAGALESDRSTHTM